MIRSGPSFGRRAFLGSGMALSAGAVAAVPLAGGGAAADTDPLREAGLLGSAGAEAAGLGGGAGADGVCAATTDDVDAGVVGE